MITPGHTARHLMKRPTVSPHPHERQALAVAACVVVAVVLVLVRMCGGASW